MRKNLKNFRKLWYSEATSGGNIQGVRVLWWGSSLFTRANPDNKLEDSLGSFGQTDSNPDAAVSPAPAEAPVISESAPKETAK